MTKILHISDFHYQKKNDSDYRDRVEKLCNDVKGKHIDLIVFSGDLVYEGGKLSIFTDASEILFGELQKATGLDRIYKVKFWHLPSVFLQKLNVRLLLNELQKP